MRKVLILDKSFHVVEGSNHMQLYDVPKYVDEAVSVLAHARRAYCSWLLLNATAYMGH
jgi:hypothetical protein